jgi:aspartyl-tRNA(Asn)/glutamyl-tRNA(Gln) amidotransferase subunit A
VGELARAAAEELCAAAGVDVVDRPFAPADPLRLWLGAGNLDLWADVEKGMWPDRADELGGLARSSFKKTSELSAAQMARPFARRWELDAAVAELFADVDLLFTPTTALPPFQAEGPMPFSVDGKEYVGGPTPFTMLANLCWNPAISLPAGVTSAGLPVGVQIVARRHRDELPLRLGRIWEQTRPWPRLAPVAQ